MKHEFLVCKHCGNMIAMVKDMGVSVKCCGEDMVKLVPNTVDASKEKHVPVYEVEGNMVKVVVGDVEHPMAEEHHIEWIMIETDKGNQRKVLAPNEAPKAEFALLDGEKVVAVYAYCNLHGLWQA